MPLINGKFYMNPAYGRALERVRQPDANTETPVQQDQAADNHWVTIDHRHLFIEETRSRIARTARKYGGSTAWAFDKRKDNFGPNTNKCNRFVYDVTKEAGAPAVVIGSDAKPRPPLAAEWADSRVSIPDWRVLGPTEQPQPGDVAAYKLTGGGTSFSGHSGIVTRVDPDRTVHAIAAHDYVVGPDDKFNSDSHRRVTYRRYTGGR